VKSKSEADVDALFALPSSEFVAARKELATKLKKSGLADEAAQVSALAKPPVSAWVVNQLYWRHGKTFDRLLEAGERLRHAQVAQLSGKAADVRSLLDARNNVVSELSRIAAEMLQEGEHNPSPAMLRRISLTLEAVSFYGSLPGGPTPGRLTADVDPPGFEALAQLVPNAKVVAFQVPAKPKPRPDLRTAKTALEEAERSLSRMQESAREALARQQEAAAQKAKAEKRRREAEEAFDEARAAEKEARERERTATIEAERAAKLLESAMRAVEEARRRLESLK